MNENEVKIVLTRREMNRLIDLCNVRLGRGNEVFNILHREDFPIDTQGFIGERKFVEGVRDKMERILIQNPYRGGGGMSDGSNINPYQEYTITTNIDQFLRCANEMIEMHRKSWLTIPSADDYWKIFNEHFPDAKETSS